MVPQHSQCIQRLCTVADDAADVVRCRQRVGERDAEHFQRSAAGGKLCDTVGLVDRKYRNVGSRRQRTHKKNTYTNNWSLVRPAIILYQSKFSLVRRGLEISAGVGTGPEDPAAAGPII